MKVVASNSIKVQRNSSKITLLFISINLTGKIVLGTLRLMSFTGFRDKEAQVNFIQFERAAAEKKSAQSYRFQSLLFFLDNIFLIL